jgi:glycerophosphoryl diester phosphodiesterase
MKKLLLILAFFIFGQAHAQKYLAFNTPADLHRFFSFEKGRFIISGHRGSVENGLPENSIAAMAEVLKHTPAFFEIDPRLTKDSVIILMHDATLNRTTNGTGKVSDYTWKELQKLSLKDKDGNITRYKIPTLEQAIKWAKGKTVLNLDQKDVPLEMSANLIKKLNAYTHVMVTVHSPEQAAYYLKQNADQMLSAHIQTEEKLKSYVSSRIPFNRMIAYIGSSFKPENQRMLEQLNAEGIMCMMAAAPVFDKIKDKAERFETYKKVKQSGASILESDFPISVAEALKN